MATEARHHSFPNPTIQEALCEIQFRTEPSKPWTPSLFAEFYEQIRGRFSRFEPVPLVGMQVEVGPGTVSQAVLPPKQMMRYRHGARENLLLQLADNLLSVNLLPRYPGWETMRQDIQEAWQEVLSVIGPSAITRVALRYINTIERGSDTEKLGEWIAESRYVPNAILESLPGLFYRLQSRMDEATGLVLTLAETPDRKRIIEDIECVSEKEMPPDPHGLGKTAAALHDAAWDVFISSASPRLKRHLEGRE